MFHPNFGYYFSTLCNPNESLELYGSFARELSFHTVPFVDLGADFELRFAWCQFGRQQSSLLQTNAVVLHLEDDCPSYMTHLITVLVWADYFVLEV